MGFVIPWTWSCRLACKWKVVEAISKATVGEEGRET